MIRWRVAGRVLAKELRETVRDRRTLMMMVVIPVFLYPVLLVVMEQAMIFGQRSLSARTARVAVAGGSDPALARFLDADSGVQVVAPGTDPARSLREGQVEAVVVLPPAAAAGEGTARVRLLYDGSSDRSRHASDVVGGRLSAWSDTLLARRLETRGLPAAFARPLAVADSSVASAEETGGYALSRFLPAILVLMTVLGAFYPAIDLAAGEKERGTLETLLTAPVPAREIVAGKFAAVAVLGMAAAALNLASMLLTFQSGLFKLSRAGLDFSLPLGSVLLVLLGLVPLAVLFSAVFLGLAVRAQSFKEAQNALTPVYVVSVLPTLLASMPGIEFTPGMALVPVAGINFLFRALMSGDVPAVPALLALGSTVAYAALALGLAARAFGREEVLFGSGPGEEAPGRSWRERLRGAPGGRRVPGPREAVAFVAGMALLFFYLAPRLMGAWGERGVLASTLLLIGLPAVLFATAGPFDARRTLGIRPVGARTLGAGLLIALGGMPLGWALGWLQLRLLSLEVPREMMGALQKLVTADDPARYAWLVLIVALAPGLCEELAFRGVLMRALARRMAGWRAVVLSAAVFGAFHLSYETAVRFVPTMWLGLLLGYVAWYSRSTLPGILMHALNNALVVTLVSVPALRALVFRGDEAGTPWWPLVAVAPLVLGLGAWLLPKRAGAEEEDGEAAAAEPAATAVVAG